MQADTSIQSLGACRVPSPLPLNCDTGDMLGNFTPEGARVRFDVETGGL